MLSVTDAWREAITKQGAQVRILVEFFTSDGTFTLLDGISDTMDHDTAILRIDQLGAKLDPITRETKVDAVDITIADQWARPIVAATDLKGKEINVYLGERTLDRADYIRVFSGRIENVLPQKDRQGVVFQCHDMLSFLMLRKLHIEIPGYHPLEALSQILEDVGLDSTQQETSSFDPSDPANSLFSHYLVSWTTTFFGLNEDDAKKQKADDVVNQLLFMLRGNLTVTGDGKVQFKAYKTTPDEEWTESDIIEFEQLGDTDDVINRVVINLSGEFNVQWVVDEDGPRQEYGPIDAVYTANDTISQNDYRWLGHGDGIYEREFALGFLFSNNAIFEVDASYTSFDTTMRIEHMSIGVVLCGTYNRNFPAAQPSWSQLAPFRRAFLLVDSEIVSCTTPITYSESCSQLSAFQTGNTGVLERPEVATYSNLTRGDLGTTAEEHGYNSPIFGDDPFNVRDVTIAHDVAQYLLDRFSRGVQRISVTTDISKCYLQVGDIVAMTYPDYLSRGATSLNTATSWEIVMREVDADRATCKFELVVAKSGAITAFLDVKTAAYSSQSKSYRARVLDDTSFDAHLKEPVSVTDVGGTTIEIGEANVTAGDRNLRSYDTVQKDLADDTRTFVYYDVIENRYVFKEQDLPGLTVITPSNAWAALAVVTVESGSITEIDTSVQQTTAMNGSKVVEFSLEGDRVGEQELTSFHRDPDEIGRNLIKNGDFGQNLRDIADFAPDGWEAKNGITDEDTWQSQITPETPGQSGNRYLRCQGGQSYFRSDFFPLETETIYSLEQVIRFNDNYVFSGLVWLEAYDGDKVFLTEHQVSFPDSANLPLNEWYALKRVEYFVEQFNDSARYGRFRFEASAGVGDQLDWDRIKFKRALQSWYAYTIGNFNVPFNTVTPIPIESVVYDYSPINIGGNEYGAFIGPGTNAGTYIVLQPGQYTVGGAVTFGNVPTTDQIECGLLVNGALTTSGSRVAGAGTAGFTTVRCTVRSVLDLVKDDTIELYAYYFAAGGSRTTVGGANETYLTGFRKAD